MQKKAGASVTLDGVSIMLVTLLGLVNLAHLLFTFWLITEQMDTGWGYGTNMEMAVLMPWMIEALSIPVLLGALIYEIAAWRAQYRGGLHTAASLLAAGAVMQFALTNVFIWY